MGKGNPDALAFYLLGLNLNKVRLFKASRNEISEIPLNGIPKNLKEAIGKDEFEKQLQAHSSTGISERSRKKIFHGHGAGKEHSMNNIFHFFRKIDTGLNKMLEKKDLPLVIAGVDYLLPIYKKANRYPTLLKKGITGNTERIGYKELHKKSLPIVASYYLNPKK
jgi:hypothetical protein